MPNLTDELYSQLQGAPLQQISQQLGVDPQQADSAVSAVAQLSEYTAARARIARFTRRKVAGVLKPASPLVSGNGNAVPPACRCAFPSSSSFAMWA